MKSRVILSILLGLSFLLNMSCDINKAEPLPPEWVFNPTVPVFINPKSQYVKPGAEFSVNVEVMPGRWGVAAAELKINFDPRAFEAVSIRPGNLMGDRVLIGMEEVDNDKGTISYAVARAGGTSTPGTRDVYAIIKFKARDSAKGNFNIKIAKFGLANEKFEDVPGLIAQGTTVIVD